MAVNKLSDKAEAEVIALYKDKSVKISEINTAFGLSGGTLYSILGRHRIPPRSPQPPRRPKIEAPVQVPDQPDTHRAITPAYTPPPQSLTVNAAADGIVLDVRRDPSSMLWEVRYEGRVKIAADTIEDAIARAKATAGVRQIVSARLVQRGSH